MNTQSKTETNSNSSAQNGAESDVVGLQPDNGPNQGDLSSEHPAQRQQNVTTAIVAPEPARELPPCNQDIVAEDSTSDSSEQRDANPQAQSVTQTETSLDDKAKQSIASKDEIIGQIEQLSETLNSALEEGQLKDCLSLHEKIQAKIKLLSEMDCDSKRLKKIKRRVTGSYQKVKELKEWRQWGIEQSRLELISKLDRLAENQGDPMQLHRELKDLRKMWEEWTKSGEFPNRATRERYTAAYEKAFRPCKVYFKQQKKQRKSNRKARKNICTSLEEFHESIDWQNPDWSAINEAIRAARNQWKKAVPLTKKDWSKTNDHFDRIIGQFEPHLDRERQRGLAFRQELIEIAESLDSEPVKVATEKVKQLQRDWKTVVIRGKKKQENTLWKKFHNACDRQFQRRGEILGAGRTKQRESTNTKKALLGEMQNLNGMPISQISESESKASEIQRQWKTTAKFRDKSADSLDRQFNDEVKKFREKIRQHKRLQFKATLSALETKATLCDEIELTAVKRECGSNTDSFQTKWDGIKDDCGEFEGAIRGRFESACCMLQGKNGNCSEMLEENLQTKQKICLELEVLAKIDSPPEFEKERMKFKLARLKTAMVDHNLVNDLETETNLLLANYWLTGAVPEHEHEPLSERFNRIRNELSKTP